jgi:hypothetical protein
MHTDTADMGTQPARSRQSNSARTRQRKLRLRTTADLDMRTAAGKRARALAAIFEATLGGQLTDAQRLAISNAAALSAIAEDAQARRLHGDSSVNLDDLVRLVSCARLAVRDLGLDDRRREPVVQTLEDYLASKGAE